MAKYRRGSPQQLAIAEKQRKALDLRTAGATYDFIATQLGYANESGARRAVNVVQQRYELDSIELYRVKHVLELDSLRRALIANARNAQGGEYQLKVVDRILAIEKREAELFGLDAPTRGVTVDVSQMSDEELEAAYQRLMHR